MWVALAVCVTVTAQAGGTEDLMSMDLGDDQLLEVPFGALSHKDEPISQAPGSVFAVTAEEIRQQGFRTLQEILASVPGLMPVDDGLYELIGVRGVQTLGDLNTRILVLVDGHPLNNQVGTGQSYLGRDLPLDVRQIDRVEIIKGPVGSIYGPNAFLGVVNVVSRKAQPGGEALVSQSAARTGEAAFQYQVQQGHLAATVGASGLLSSGRDYAFPELVGKDRPAPAGGVVTHADQRSAYNVHGNIHLGDFTLSVALADRVKGLPTAPYSTVIDDPFNRIENRTIYADLSWDKRISERLDLFARLSYDDFRYQDWLAYPAESGGAFQDIGTDRWVSAETRATVTPFVNHRDVLGVHAQFHDTYQHSFYEQDLAQGMAPGAILKSFQTVNLYALAEQKVGKILSLQAGMTYFWHSLFGGQFLPKGTAVINLGNWNTVKLLYSRGVRPPTIFEAYFADGLDFIANPALRSETAQTFEVNYEHRFSARMSANAALFHNDFSSSIASVVVPDPTLNRPPDPNQPTDYRAQYQNAPGTLSVNGGELGLDFTIPRWFRAWGGVSMQRVSSAVVPANFAPLTGNLSLSTRAIHPDLYVSVSGYGMARRPKDPENINPGDSTTVAPYFLMNASVRWVPTHLLSGAAVQVSAFNFLNAQAFDPLVADHAPLNQLQRPGREIRAQVDYAF